MPDRKAASPSRTSSSRRSTSRSVQRAGVDDAVGRSGVAASCRSSAAAILVRKGNDGAARGGAADRAACRFHGEAGDLGTERGDVAQQACHRRETSRPIAEEGLGIVADPQMERRSDPM
jgi:hypothetical protein